MFVTNLIHDFIAASIAFNNKVDRFNFDNHLEQYALKASPTEVSSSETTDVSAVPQSRALGDEEVSTGADGDIDNPSSLVDELETGDV